MALAKTASKKQITRKRLIDAARCLFVKQGYANTSIDAITAQCGLTRGVFYSHFQSKRELYDLALTSALSCVQEDGLLDWDNQLVAEVMNWDVQNKPDLACLPLRFFAQDQATSETNQTYTNALKHSLQVLLNNVGSDLGRGESALLALTAMVVGAEVIAKKLDDPYLEFKLRASCRANASALGQAELPNEIKDFFWDNSFCENASWTSVAALKH